MVINTGPRLMVILYCSSNPNNTVMMYFIDLTGTSIKMVDNLRLLVFYVFSYKMKLFKAPVCDLSATDNLHQSQRSQQGPRSVPARLQRSRRLIGDLVATKSVAARFLCLHKNLAATDLVADKSRQSRRPVPDQSPTSCRPIAD